MIKKDIICENGHMLIENGAFVYTKTGKDFVIQKVKEHLLTLTGEDLQNITKGLDLKGVMFNEKASSSDIYSEILRCVLLVEEVSEVTDIKISQEKELLNITVSIKYNDEDLTVSVGFGND